MGGLKEQDPVISSTEQPVKRKQGNPNLKKGVKNPYYAGGKNEQNTSETKTNMAEEAEVVSETKNENTSSDVSNEKKIIPDDTFSDVIPNAEVLPLDGEVKTKDYANLADPTSNTASGGGGGDNKPPITPNTGDLGGGSGVPPMHTLNPDQIPPGTGPQGPPVTPEQVKTEAEQFVKLLLRGYEKLHDVARWAAKMDPHDLAMLEQKGKINLDATLALGTGKLPLRDFFKQYNDQIEEDIVVHQDFKNDITPPLERIAIKRGWGLGDEGTVGLLLAEDIGTKAALLYGLKKTCNMILESQMLILKNQREAKEAKENPKKEKADTKDFEADANAWREKDPEIEDAQEVK